VVAVTLPEYLLARYDEAEADSRGWHTNMCASRQPFGRGLFPAPACDCGVPERVQADIEAKRRMVMRYLDGDDEGTKYLHGRPPTDPHWWEPESEKLGNDFIRLLAVPFADRPDFQPEWRLP
jgi:hypothetical protein